MGSVGLELADRHTEAVLLSSRNEMETVHDVGDCTITVSQVLDALWPPQLKTTCETRY